MAPSNVPSEVCLHSIHFVNAADRNSLWILRQNTPQFSSMVVCFKDCFWCSCTAQVMVTIGMPINHDIRHVRISATGKSEGVGFCALEPTPIFSDFGIVRFEGKEYQMHPTCVNLDLCKMTCQREGVAHIPLEVEWFLSHPVDPDSMLLSRLAKTSFHVVVVIEPLHFPWAARTYGQALRLNGRSLPIESVLRVASIWVGTATKPVEIYCSIARGLWQNLRLRYEATPIPPRGTNKLPPRQGQFVTGSWEALVFDMKAFEMLLEGSYVIDDSPVEITNYLNPRQDIIEIPSNRVDCVDVSLFMILLSRILGGKLWMVKASSRLGNTLETHKIQVLGHEEDTVLSMSCHVFNYFMPTDSACRITPMVLDACLIGHSETIGQPISIEDHLSNCFQVLEHNDHWNLEFLEFDLKI